MSRGPVESGSEALRRASRALRDLQSFGSPYRNPSSEDKAWKRAMGLAAETCEKMALETGRRRLEAALNEAREMGFDPGTYQRGREVRVLLNRARNTWDDVANEDEAAEWLERRCAEARAAKVFP